MVLKKRSRKSLELQEIEKPMNNSMFSLIINNEISENNIGKLRYSDDKNSLRKINYFWSLKIIS